MQDVAPRSLWQMRVSGGAAAERVQLGDCEQQQQQQN
jgi:hypothetical protein